MSDGDGADEREAATTPATAADDTGAEPTERTPLAVDLDDEVARLGTRSATLARRFYWAFALAFWIPAAVLTYVWNIWLMLLVLFPLLLACTRPFLVVTQTLYCDTRTSVDDARADFEGPETPITAGWVALADEILTPGPDDGEDAIAVLRYSQWRGDVERVLRQTERPDGRRGITLDSGQRSPSMIVSVDSDDDGTTVAIEARRGPLSLYNLAIARLSSRYTVGILREYGYELREGEREWDVVPGAMLPW